MAYVPAWLQGAWLRVTGQRALRLPAALLPLRRVGRQRRLVPLVGGVVLVLMLLLIWWVRVRWWRVHWWVRLVVRAVWRTLRVVWGRVRWRLVLVGGVVVHRVLLVRMVRRRIQKWLMMVVCWLSWGLLGIRPVRGRAMHVRRRRVMLNVLVAWNAAVCWHGTRRRESISAALFTDQAVLFCRTLRLA